MGVGDRLAALPRPLDLRSPVVRVTQTRRLLAHMLRPGDHLIRAPGHMHPGVGHLTRGLRASDSDLGARPGGRSPCGSRMGAGFRRTGGMGASPGTSLDGLPPGFPCMDPCLHGGLAGLHDGLTLLFRQRPAVVYPV